MFKTVMNRLQSYLRMYTLFPYPFDASYWAEYVDPK